MWITGSIRDKREQSLRNILPEGTFQDIEARLDISTPKLLRRLSQETEVSHWDICSQPADITFSHCKIMLVYEFKQSHYDKARIQFHDWFLWNVSLNLLKLLAWAANYSLRDFSMCCKIILLIPRLVWWKTVVIFSSSCKVWQVYVAFLQ